MGVGWSWRQNPGTGSISDCPEPRSGLDRCFQGADAPCSWSIPMKQCINARDGRRSRITAWSSPADSLIRPHAAALRTAHEPFDRCVRAASCPYKAPNLVGTDTGVPVPGLRSTRTRWKRSEKLAKPRISMRPPSARYSAMWLTRLRHLVMHFCAEQAVVVPKIKALQRSLLDIGRKFLDTCIVSGILVQLW